MAETVSGTAPGKMLVERTSQTDSTRVQIGEARIGGGGFSFLAGLRKAWNEENIKNLKQTGAACIWAEETDDRNPGEERLSLLTAAGKKAGLPVIASVSSIRALPLLEKADAILTEGRSMQDYELLRALGRLRKPVILTRNAGSTPEELLMAGEYLLSGGNGQVIFCEQGTRTFSSPTGRSLDLTVALWLRSRTHLPIIVDPGPTVQTEEALSAMILAAAAAGVDGVMFRLGTEGDVPGLSPETFRRTAEHTQALLAALGRPDVPHPDDGRLRESAGAPVAACEQEAEKHTRASTLAV